jgi:hypothetical protein
VPAAELGALLETLAFEAEDRDAILLAATRADDVARALAAASAPSEVVQQTDEVAGALLCLG